jgi:deoxyribonuclease-4
MTKKLLIGAHTSAAGGVQNALYEGQRIGATTIQLFTSNQRQWQSRALTPETIALWQKALQETELSQIMSHDSYLINLGASDPENLIKSRLAFRSEIQRCHALEITYLNFHPGAAGKDPEEQCLDRIVESLLELEKLTAEGKTRLLLEATAGQGSSVGWQFEQLAYIIDRVKAKIPIGICLDTCHVFAAGYDLRTPKACQETFDAFDRLVGLKWLYALHLNDSQKPLGSRVDRHKPLGEGQIGIECFQWLMRHPQISSLPKYLETPDGPPLWEKEIRLLSEFANS